MGFLAKTNLITELRNKSYGMDDINFWFVLYLSDRCKIKNNMIENFNLRSAIFIEFSDNLLNPWVSRSGITISAARMMNFNRIDSANFILLSIPTLAAVSIFGLKNLVTSDNFNFSFINFIAIFLCLFFHISQ